MIEKDRCKLNDLNKKMTLDHENTKAQLETRGGTEPGSARLGSLHLWKKISKSSARARLVSLWLVK